MYSQCVCACVPQHLHVCVSVCVWLFVCGYVGKCVYVHVCVRERECVHVSGCEESVHVGVGVCSCACVSICMRACMRASHIIMAVRAFLTPRCSPTVNAHPTQQKAPNNRSHHTHTHPPHANTTIPNHDPPQLPVPPSDTKRTPATTASAHGDRREPIEFVCYEI